MAVALAVTLQPETYVLDPRNSNPAQIELTVTAVDRLGVAVTDYRGTIAIDSTDGGMRRPPEYQFLLADTGTHSFPDAGNRPGLVPSRAGLSRVRVFDIDQPSLQGTALLSTSYLPALGPAAGTYFVHPCGRDPEAGSDCSSSAPQGDGSQQKPWRELRFAVSTVPTGSTIIVGVRVDAEGNELRSVYGGDVVVNRRLNIVGESILRCQVHGTGAAGRAAVRVTPGGAGTSLRNLTIDGASARPGAWSGTGLELYATTAHVSNCVIHANQTGVDINESSSLGPNELINNNIVAQTGAGLRARKAHFETVNNIFGTQPCDAYSFLGESQRVSLIETSLFVTDQNLCGSALPPPSSAITDEATVLRGPAYANLHVVDLLADLNRVIGVLDGGDGKSDVDTTANDIGAMGGPLGERHYEASGLDLGSQEPWALFAAVVVMFAMVCVRRREAGGPLPELAKPTERQDRGSCGSNWVSTESR